jgi:hypothetical protein
MEPHALLFRVTYRSKLRGALGPATSIKIKLRCQTSRLRIVFDLKKLDRH